MPESFAQELDISEPDVRFIRLAGGLQRPCRYDEITLENEDGEERSVEVLVLEGNPLIGNVFLTQMLLEIEVAEGGNVTAETM